ncbi:MAG: CRISPR-associated endonuclease Cas3'' [Thermofilaceae archaeon]
MGCYAYRDSSGASELLYDHLVATYMLASSRWETSAISRKVSSVLNLEENEVRESILLAALLHDIGKAEKRLQDECQKGACKRFPQHYLISAFYTYTVLSEALNLKLSTSRIAAILDEDRGDRAELIILLVVFPVAFHHYHQVASYESYRKLGERDLLVHAACKDCLMKPLGEFVKEKFEVLRGVGDQLENLPNLLASNRRNAQAWILVSNIGEIIQRVARPRSFLAMAIETATGVVNLCDSAAARVHRG